MECNNCKTTIAEDSKFCQKCGTKVPVVNKIDRAVYSVRNEVKESKVVADSLRILGFIFFWALCLFEILMIYVVLFDSSPRHRPMYFMITLLIIVAIVIGVRYNLHKISRED